MSPQQDWVFGDIEDRRERLSPSRVAPRRARRAVGRFFLFLAWLVTFTIGTTCGAVLAGGLLRDGTFTDARVALDLSRRGEWRRYHFHPSVPGQYVLYLTSDDGEDRAEEHPFTGRVYVRVENQKGRAELSERYEPPALDHRLRGGVEWTRLGALHVNSPSIDPWTLAVRVGPADDAFAKTKSSLLVVRDKRIPGLEGLANYIAAPPALLFLALSVLAAIGLPRRGGTWIPALLSILLLAAVAEMIYLT